jgi:hypothetical protein
MALFHPTDPNHNIVLIAARVTKLTTMSLRVYVYTHPSMQTQVCMHRTHTVYVWMYLSPTHETQNMAMDS